jgi:hypothetical protein
MTLEKFKLLSNINATTPTGTKLISCHNMVAVMTLVGPAPNSDTLLVVEINDNLHYVGRSVHYVGRSDVKIEPLTWLEDRPVYAGDTLRHIYTDIIGQVVSVHTMCLTENLKMSYGSSAFTHNMTWDLEIPKRKVTYERWANIYPSTKHVGFSNMHDTKHQADANADHDRIDCVKVIWEE